MSAAIAAYATIRAAGKTAEATVPGQTAQPATPAQSRGWVGLAFGSIVIAVSLLFYIAYTVTRLENSAQVVATDDNFTADADADERPYVLDSVVSNVEIEDTPTAKGKKQRRCYVKTTYVLHVLRDITDGYFESKRGRKIAFREEYSTNQYKRFKWWLGTEKQEPVSTERNSYNLYFSAKKGQTYTLLTGGTYTYDLPLADNRLTPDSQPLLANEDYYMYKNSEDYIKSLLIVIHSQTTKLSLPRRAAFKIEADQPTRSDGQVFQDDLPTTNDQISLSARFTYLKPDMHGGVRYRW